VAVIDWNMGGMEEWIGWRLWSSAGNGGGPVAAASGEGQGRGGGAVRAAWRGECGVVVRSGGGRPEMPRGSLTTSAGGGSPAMTARW
jgi:hypothetical protein